jgi:predicted MarR family transcription regulator
MTTEDISRKHLRAKAVAAIKKQLKEPREAQDWSSLRSEYCTVPDRTWWRWVASSKKSVHRSGDAESSDFPLHTLDIVEADSSEERDALKNQHIRAIAAAMVKQLKDIDFLQSHAVGKDGGIKNFAIFAQALSLRDRAMVSFVRTITPIVDKLAHEDFFNTVVDTIAAIDKDTSLQIMRSLQKLQTGLKYVPA